MSDLIKICITGDLFPANAPYDRGCGVAAMDLSEAGRKRYAERIKGIIGDNDIICGNLESPVLKPSGFSSDMQFAGHTDFVKLLKEAGFNVAVLANNHILEHGDEGLDSTIDFLKQSGIDYAGVDGKRLILEKEGLSLAFLSYNSIDINRFQSNRVNAYSEDAVIRDIKDCKDKGADYVFVMLHWGDEYIHRPSSEQIGSARKFIDAGASFVMGCHPHVIQPIEKYCNGLICYSLGNFIFDMLIPKAVKTGMVLKLELSKEAFSFSYDFVEIGDDFFPSVLSVSKPFENLLKSQTELMDNWQSPDYQKKYNREKKSRRRFARIVEKRVLLRNWHKFSPAVKKEFIDLYLRKLRLKK
jgi:poly-gamma-glutamate synthesis protein (capsule biosynthesis protein)